MRIAHSRVLSCRLKDHGEVCRGWENRLPLDNVTTQPGDVCQVEEASPSGLLGVVVMDEPAQELMGEEWTMFVRLGYSTLVPVRFGAVERIRGKVRQEFRGRFETGIDSPKGDGGSFQVQGTEHLYQAKLGICTALERPSIMNLGRLPGESPHGLLDRALQLEVGSQLKKQVDLARATFSHAHLLQSVSETNRGD